VNERREQPLLGAFAGL